MDIKQKCVEVFVEVMSVDPGAINDETSPETLEEWDSLSHVQLILGLEKGFGIEIAPDEGIELEDFKMVCEFIGGKLH